MFIYYIINILGCCQRICFICIAMLYNGFCINKKIIMYIRYTDEYDYFAEGSIA